MLEFLRDIFWFVLTRGLVRLVERLDRNARLDRLASRGAGWNPEHVASVLSVFDPLDAGSRKKALALYAEVAKGLVASCPISEECSLAQVESAYLAALQELGEYPPAFKRGTTRVVTRLHAIHALANRNWHAETW